jgi:plastocyanin
LLWFAREPFIARVLTSQRPSGLGVGLAQPRALIALCLVALALPRATRAQSLLERSPNIGGGWVGLPGTLHFNFLHRFTKGAAPTRKVTSSPTFLMAAGLPWHSLVGFSYATNSDVAPRYPNEWEFFARVAPLGRERRWPLDVSLQGGYNLAARSADGELTLGRQLGPVRVRAAGRAFSDAYDLGETKMALAGGGVLRLGRYLALAGDYASLLDKPVGFDDAWSAALQIAIPYTPHTLSLQATNTNTATLQGSSASRGGQRRYGFEFTIPVTLRRYFGRPAPRVAAPAAAGAPSPAPAAADAAGVVQAGIRQLVFFPARIEIAAGTTVQWKNGDPLAHTVTADDGAFDSGNIDPGQSWRRRFDTPGTYSFHCTPHPFMKGVIVVR